MAGDARQSGVLWIAEVEPGRPALASPRSMIHHGVAMTLEDQLLTAVAADPEDEGALLVLADWLQSIGDARGELILLDHGDRANPGGLADPTALERLLLLAAEYGFPRARPHQDAALAFTRVGRYPIQCQVDHDGRRYDLRYDDHALSILVDEEAIYSSLGASDEIALPRATRSGDWTDEEARVILTIVSDAIRAGSPIEELRFPYSERPLPVYDGGPARVYELPFEFRAPRGLLRWRYGLAARDHERWHATWDRLRIAEHERAKRAP